MNLKAIALGAAAIAALAVATGTANATIAIGDTIELTYLFPDTSTVFQTNTTTFTGAGTTLPIIYTGTAFFDANQIQLVQQYSSYYTSAAFNGVMISDLTNPGAFAGWGVIPTTTTAPITEFMQGGSIFVNWESAPTTGVVTLGPSAGGVPEASTWAMMGLGFAGLAFAGARASRKHAALFV